MANTSRRTLRGGLSHSQQACAGAAHVFLVIGELEHDMTAHGECTTFRSSRILKCAWSVVLDLAPHLLHSDLLETERE
jgi:hypothetical protein